MFPFVLYHHHLGTRLVRENIKRKLQNDIQTPSQLLTELNNIISEQESSYGYTFVNKTEKYEENLQLKHAKDHLTEFNNNTEQTQQKDATMNVLNES